MERTTPLDYLGRESIFAHGWHSGAENRSRIGTFSLEERCAAVKHYPRKLWYFRKDLNLDHALIGRGSCRWTTEVNLVPEDGFEPPASSL